VLHSFWPLLVTHPVFLFSFPTRVFVVCQPE
jgi:hypothetical protein